VAALAFLAERRRRDQLTVFATARGWSVTERDDRWCEAFAGAPFGRGHNRQARNVIQGDHGGRPFVAFDYVYYTTETSTDSQGRVTRREVPHRFSVVGLGIGSRLPTLQVSPEGFFSRAVGRLTNRDIQLESEEFNRAFSVVSSDRRFAFDILHPRLMEYLLTVPDVAWRTTGEHILTIEDGRHDPTDIDRRLAVIDTVLDHVPDFVRRQYGLPSTPEPR
jgi:hypothetical protein